MKIMSSSSVFVFLLGLCVASCVNFTTVFDWGDKEFDLAWPSEASKKKAVDDGLYKQNEVEINYLAVYKERIFLSLIKYDGDITPVTLVSLPTTSSKPPKLAPFPSWETHTGDGCEGIKDARGLEVDLEGRLWVVDQGSENCSAKLWIFNLADNDKVELVHVIPDTVAELPSRDLRDIVLDRTPNETFAYISDIGTKSFVAFALKRNESWKMETPGDVNYISKALSPDLKSRKLYASKHWELFSVPAVHLRTDSEDGELELVGRFSARPYRMLIDSENILYAAFIISDYISTWNTSEPFNEKRIYEGGQIKAWRPFAFAIDAKENLWLTQRNQTESRKPTYKLLKAAVGAKSYLYGSSSVSTDSPSKRGTTPSPAQKSN